MKFRLLALFCTCCLLLTAVPSAGALTGDVTRSADTLATLSLMREDSRSLDARATRADGVELLVRLAASRREAAADNWISGFRDVPPMLQTAVNYASHQGWVAGTTVVTFAPDRPLTANAWYTFLLRVLGYRDADGDFEVAEAARFAWRIGLTPTLQEGVMTLGQLYQSAKDALFFSYRDGSETMVERLVRKGECSRAAANALGLLSRELTAREAADRCMAAVFQMDVFEDAEHIDRDKPDSMGSGFFITADGIALTNYHALDGAAYAEATLATGEHYPVERVLFYDKEMDLAIIRLPKVSLEGKKTSAFSWLKLGDPAEVRTGDTVYTIGNPLGLGLAVSTGVVSDPARKVKSYTLPCIMNTADISQGSSGGVLMNVFGEAVAITSGAYTRGNNMYLSVPVTAALTADLTVEGKTIPEVTAEVAAAEAKNP